MPSYGRVSQERLDTCHPDLQAIMGEVIKRLDIAIICGHRNETAQRAAYESGKSQVNYPNSKHNSYPSMAVDIAPYPIDWNDRGAFALMAGWVLCTADRLLQEGKVTHSLRWGGDWDADRRTLDHSFLDYPHFELRGSGQ